MDTLPKLALSIRQPWAWCIVNLGKDIENRDWPTRFRGPVCIHAAKGMTRAEYEDCVATAHAISRTRPFPQGGTFPQREELQRGGIVATAEIVNCVDRSASPWFFGTFGFVLRNVQPVDFIPVKGALSFFEWRKNLDAP
ncbi:hypothetical protein G6L63_08490 [Agrobacterium vitis]|uniref:ASCH domain-containing protein n=1 Tax=Agrobacterium vitis TaxID=373 RepID=UPI001574146D|nr:ASCH domain-containing protein [Agrobacterium vitis]NSZ47951.1 hypothetical protein [Agrobacterium vitis]UJL72891.1 hypothetical protein AVCG412_08725 [Agrobacterium vitis]